MAIKIDVNGNATQVSVNGLKDLQEQVGGMIEYVGDVMYEGVSYQMLADEEGMFKSNPTINSWALLNANKMLTGAILLCDKKEFN